MREPKKSEGKPGTTKCDNDRRQALIVGRALLLFFETNLGLSKKTSLNQRLLSEFSYYYVKEGKKQKRARSEKLSRIFPKSISEITRKTFPFSKTQVKLFVWNQQGHITTSRIQATLKTTGRERNVFASKLTSTILDCPAHILQ